MSQPVFFFADGDLWWRNHWRTREDMERQAEHFEAQPQEGLYAETARELAAECRAALRDYDEHYAGEKAA